MERQAVPLVGVSVFLACGAATMLADLRQQRLDRPESSRAVSERVLIRYLSMATHDTKRAPHWIFLAGTTAYLPTVILTAVWQAELVELLSPGAGGVWSRVVV
eukprot:scaffold45426_cov63-Phaeocystis_antarctica.AAC.1